MFSRLLVTWLGLALLSGVLGFVYKLCHRYGLLFASQRPRRGDGPMKGKKASRWILTGFGAFYLVALVPLVLNPVPEDPVAKIRTAGWMLLGLGGVVGVFIWLPAFIRERATAEARAEEPVLHTRLLRRRAAMLWILVIALPALVAGALVEASLFSPTSEHFLGAGGAALVFILMGVLSYRGVQYGVAWVTHVEIRVVNGRLREASMIGRLRLASWSWSAREMEGLRLRVSGEETKIGIGLTPVRGFLVRSELFLLRQERKPLPLAFVERFVADPTLAKGKSRALEASAEQWVKDLGVGWSVDLGASHEGLSGKKSS